MGIRIHTKVTCAHPMSDVTSSDSRIVTSPMSFLKTTLRSHGSKGEIWREKYMGNEGALEQEYTREQESTRAQEYESMRAGEYESRRAGEQESRRVRECESINAQMRYRLRQREESTTKLTSYDAQSREVRTMMPSPMRRHACVVPQVKNMVEVDVPLASAVDEPKDVMATPEMQINTAALFKRVAFSFKKMMESRNTNTNWD